MRLAQRARLVYGEIDDAVRDDYVNGIIRQRNILDVSLEELDVICARALPVLVRERKHLVGHVDTVGISGRSDAASGEEDIDAAARAEVENHFSRIQLGQRSRVAAPK